MDELEAILETGGAAAVEMAASALLERGGKVGHCANCGHPMIGPYCAVCGQPLNTHRRSLKHLLHEIVKDIVSFDSRILRTAKALLVEPGELPRSFLEGRTQRYMPAVRLYLFVSLIFFVILGVSGIAILQLELVAAPQKIMYDANGNPFIPNLAYDPSDPDLKDVPKNIQLPKEEVSRMGAHYAFETKVYFFAPIGAHHKTLPQAALDQLQYREFKADLKSAGQDAAKKKTQEKTVKIWLDTHLFGGFRRLATNPAALNEPLTTWIPRVLFLLLPLYALLLAAFYRRQRQKFFFVDHLIFSLSVHTFTFVALIVAVGLAQLVSGEWVFWFLLASIGVYVLLSLKRFYEQNWFWTGLKFVFISGIYVIFLLLPTLCGVVALSFLYT